jgi:hypothetical protein
MPNKSLQPTPGLRTAATAGRQGRRSSVFVGLPSTLRFDATSRRDKPLPSSLRFRLHCVSVFTAFRRDESTRQVVHREAAGCFMLQFPRG